jgi:ubiquitin-conjugating enzyme E2 A
MTWRPSSLAFKGVYTRETSEAKADIGSLLNDPNTSSPANVEASNLYKDNRKEYHKRVRESVEKSWDD